MVPFHVHIHKLGALRKLYHPSELDIQDGREISVIVVTDDYLCYKKPKRPYNFFYFNI